MVFFSWLLEFSVQLQRFSIAHTVKDKHPQLCLIPLIVMYLKAIFYLREQAKELIFISYKTSSAAAGQHWASLLICNIPTTVSDNNKV